MSINFHIVGPPKLGRNLRHVFVHSTLQQDEFKSSIRLSSTATAYLKCIVFLSELRITSHNYDQTITLFVRNQPQLPTSVCAFWPTCPPIRLSCSLSQLRNSAYRWHHHRCCSGRLHFLSVSECILGFRRAASWFWRFDTSLCCLASNQTSLQHFWKPQKIDENPCLGPGKHSCQPPDHAWNIKGWIELAISLI